jgi:hypothetical protein
MFLYLQFAPELAFVATDAVHDTRNVSEMLSELGFHFHSLTAAVEHGALVKVVGKVPIG